MENNIGALEPVRNLSFGSDICLQKEAVCRLVRRLHDIEIDELTAKRGKPADQMSADEPGTARDQGVGGKEQLQGALSHYELLSHMAKGNFVFHTGGWGVGEIMDVSMIRQQLSVEFEYVPGKKDISFANAFNTLIPIPDDHFLALRFGNPDLLEKNAKENPASKPLPRNRAPDCRACARPANENAVLACALPI